MISSSYEAEGERFTKVRCTMKNPGMFQRGSAPIDWSIDRTIASRFGASFMPPGRSMFSAKMTAPVGGPTQPTHQPICGSDTRLPSGLCPQDPIAPGLDDHDILDQTLMLDLNGSSFRYSFRRKSTCSMAETGGRRRARSDRHLRTGRRCHTESSSQILLFAHLTDLTGKLLIHPYVVECLMDERRV